MNAPVAFPMRGVLCRAYSPAQARARRGQLLALSRASLRCARHWLEGGTDAGRAPEKVAVVVAGHLLYAYAYRDAARLLTARACLAPSAPWRDPARDPLALSQFASPLSWER